jgi:alpha-beta hydrolase superfamily lysophospholipase
LKRKRNQWLPDILGDGFEQTTIQMESDREGDVFCTLVRAVDTRQYDRNVLYIHGFSDYFFQTELADRFRENGFNFYALDLRKCGRSIRPWQTPFNLYSINEYYDDFDAAIDIIRTETNGKLTLLGHSTGGLALSVYLQCRPADWADALILNSPFFELNIKESYKKRGLPLIMFLGKYCPYLKIYKGLSPNYGNSISKRKFGEWDFNEKWKPLAVSTVNVSWLRAICMAQTFLQSGLNIRCPVLVMRSEKSFKSKQWSEEFRKTDAVLNVEHIGKYASKLGENVTEIAIKDGLHDLILSAPEVRTEVYKRMFEWLRANCLEHD